MAWQPNFYDVSGLEGRLSTEGWLAGIEDAAAPIVTRLITQPSAITSLSRTDEMLLARFLATLRFRGPHFRAQFADLQAQLGGQIREMLDHLSTQPRYRKLAAWWKENKHQSDEWLASRGERVDVAGLVASQLEEIMGYANLLRVMPWRIGVVPSQRPLFTSDNPLAGWLNPAQVMQLGFGPFTAYEYYVPLSPRVLLRIGFWNGGGEDDDIEPQGERVYRDFPMWDTAFALNVVTMTASRFLFGDGAYRVREPSARTVERINGNIAAFRRLLGLKSVPSKFFPPDEYDDTVP